MTRLTNLGGRERAEAEDGALFAAAGFALTATPVHGEVRLIVGAPA